MAVNASMYTGGMFYSVYRRCCARESVISQEAVSPHSAEAMATVKLPRRDSEMLNLEAAYDGLLRGQDGRQPM